MDTLARVVAQGYERIVLVGVDTPGLRASDVRAAITQEGAVIGPSLDGGFYLLGLPSDRVAQLRGLPWCTDRARAALMQRLRKCAAPIHQLPARQDVDNAQDAAQLHGLLERLSRCLCGASLSLAPELRLDRAGAIARPCRFTPQAQGARAPPSPLSR